MGLKLFFVSGSFGSPVPTNDLRFRLILRVKRIGGHELDEGSHGAAAWEIFIHVSSDQERPGGYFRTHYFQD